MRPGCQLDGTLGGCRFEYRQTIGFIQHTAVAILPGGLVAILVGDDGGAVQGHASNRLTDFHSDFRLNLNEVFRFHLRI